MLVLFKLITYFLYPTVTYVSTCHHLCVYHPSHFINLSQIFLRYLFLFDFLFHLVCTNLMEIHSWVYNNKALMHNSTATSILWDIHVCIFCHSFPLNQGDSPNTICIIPIKIFMTVFPKMFTSISQSFPWSSEVQFRWSLCNYFWTLWYVRYNHDEIENRENNSPCSLMWWGLGRLGPKPWS